MGVGVVDEVGGEEEGQDIGQREGPEEAVKAHEDWQKEGECHAKNDFTRQGDECGFFG